MTEPVAPILGLQELFATRPATADVMTWLQAVEDRLAAALLRLESVGTADVALPAATNADSQPTSSWVSQLFSVIVSGPVIGFLLILLLVLAATARLVGFARRDALASEISESASSMGLCEGTANTGCCVAQTASGADLSEINRDRQSTAAPGSDDGHRIVR